MPEGHTVHRLALNLAQRFGGRVLAVSSPQGRFRDGAALLDGRRCTGTDADGKHLFVGFEGERWLHVHLGLFGRWTIGTGPAPEVRGALRVRLQTGVGGGGRGAEPTWADLRGPTACEVWTPAEKAALHARLGPDPLRPDADPQRAWARISRSRSPVGLLLMDQSVLAGVGNVYRAEVLHRHGVDPHRPGRTLTREEWDAMWRDLVVLMRAGVRSGRIVTTRPADRPRGRVRRETAHYVYRRAALPCRVCGTEVRTDVMGARNLYWCPTCQR